MDRPTPPPHLSVAGIVREAIVLMLCVSMVGVALHYLFTDHHPPVKILRVEEVDHAREEIRGRLHSPVRTEDGTSTRRPNPKYFLMFDTCYADTDFLVKRSLAALEVGDEIEIAVEPRERDDSEKDIVRNTRPAWNIQIGMIIALMAFGWALIIRRGFRQFRDRESDQITS